MELVRDCGRGASCCVCGFGWSLFDDDDAERGVGLFLALDRQMAVAFVAYFTAGNKEGFLVGCVCCVGICTTG